MLVVWRAGCSNQVRESRKPSEMNWGNSIVRLDWLVLGRNMYPKRSREMSSAAGSWAGLGQGSGQRCWWCLNRNQSAFNGCFQNEFKQQHSLSGLVLLESIVF